MIYGLYHSAAGMLTNEYRQEVIANNLANADTVGFKRDMATFAERSPESLAGGRTGASDAGLAGLSGGLWLGRTSTDYSEGNKVHTENPLDVALDGPGFLSVSANGQRLLTRDGRMRLDRDGRLVAASDGAAVLGRGGTQIQTNPVGGEVTIGEDGRVAQDGAIVGQLDLVDYASYAALKKTGASRFVPPEQGAGPAAASVKSGYVENSGVEPLTELVGMIEATRSYQMNAQMISLQDQTVGRLIGVIAR